MRAHTGIEHGFTLIEVIVATGILAIAIAVALSTLSETQEVAGVTMARAHLQSLVRGVADEIAGDLRNGAPGSMAVPSGTGTEGTPAPEVLFQVAAGFADGEVVWSDEATRYSEASYPGEDPSNGADDNGNGIVDERRIVHEVGTIALDGTFEPTMSRNILAPAGGTEPGVDAQALGFVLGPGGRIAVTVRAVRPTPGDGPGQAGVASDVTVVVIPRNE